MFNKVLAISIFAFLPGINNFLHSQVFLNGNFEINTAFACDYNLGNPTFTSKMSNAVAYGGGNECDIMSTCPYGTAQNGTWFVGIACSGGVVTDAFTMQLSAPLVAGTTYNMKFYDEADIACCPPGTPVIIGVSTVAGSGGTVVYTGPVPTGAVWNLRCFSFVAPNNGQYISVTTAIALRWSHVDNFSFGACPLPIELVDFKSECQNNKVALNWITATEKSNKYFNIEHSIDGKHFESIGTVKGAGNSLEKLKYSFTDESPLRGTSYYRLGQVDYDGSITYSSIISTEDCYNKIEGDFQIFPNPANSLLNVNVLHVSDDCRIVITNCVGEIVVDEAIETTINRIDISKFNEGIYFLKIIGNDGVFAKKFIKN